MSSPSFPILQIYERRGLEIYHFDFFRLGRFDDAFELGIEEAFTDGVSLIEWPERLGLFLPEKSLIIEISLIGGITERLINFSGSKIWSERLKNI